MHALQQVITIESGLLETMIIEGRRTFPLETGGVLMGFATAERVVVTGVVGPGPRAVHWRHSFTPDTEWQQDSVADLYERAGRRDTYLGDWHTHPRGSTRASFMDWNAARTIARARDARCPNPVMLIMALSDEHLAKLGAYRWNGLILSRFREVAVTRRRCDRGTHS